MGKENGWVEYYRHYLREGEEHGTSPLDLQDETYRASSKDLITRFVLPHLREDHAALEIGSGIGRLSRFVAPRCKTLVCVDILEGALQEAQRILADSPNIEFEKINGYDLSNFPAKRFDVVYSFGTFFHFDFELVVHYLSEIRRVLKKKGVGVVEFKQLTTVELEALLRKIENRGIETYEAHAGKFRYVTPEMLRVVCEHFGLTVLNEEFSGFTFMKSG
jgi:ubiquinone/menaquinone biosynthesis C-methylase UbiE